jgi:CBS domain containing-hemolysin-like protein
MEIDLSGFLLSGVPLVVALPVFLAFSAFFSASEVAFFSLKSTVVTERATSDATYAKINALLEAPKRLLATMLIGNTIANAAFVVTSVVLAEKWMKEKDVRIDEGALLLVVALAVLGMALCILIIGEIGPKTFAAKHPESVAVRLVRVVSFFQILFYPFTEAAIQATKFLESLVIELKIKVRGKKEFSDEEIQAIAELGIERANLEQTEKRLIDSVLDFREKPVRKIMTPRTDIVALDVETSIQEAIEVVIKTKRSRLPLYEENLDHILGVIYAKDLVKYMSTRKKFDKEQWLKIARQPIFVPESQHLDDVLREFQKTRMHLAVVVDEYGGTAGIATLEDVIVEIVGELSPSQKNEEHLYKAFDDGALWFDASISLEEASEVLGKALAQFQADDEQSYDTLGGFIMHFTGEIPDEKQRVRFADLEFEIEKLDGNRILSVFVRKV